MVSDTQVTDSEKKAASTDPVEAVRLLEQAVRVGCSDRQVLFMLALAYKRLGRNSDARQALRKIGDPDVHVHLQLGVLAFAEKAFEEAEAEFSKALENAPDLYAAAYNVLLCQLAQGRVDAAAELVPKIAPLATSSSERNFLLALEALLSLLPNRADRTAPQAVSANGSRDRETLLAGLDVAQEERLLQTLAGLGQLEVAYPLLCILARARPKSFAAQEAHLEVLLLQARQLVDRGQWEEARDLLAPKSRAAAEPLAGNAAPRPTHVALLNMLGCCACMLQDFDQAVSYFAAALGKVGNDAWLHQNLALAYEWLGRLEKAESHWNRYFELLDARVPAPALPRYLESLAFEGLVRLSDVYFKREKWSKSLTHLQRAHRYRPDDPDTLERLFHLYTQLKKNDEARRVLRRLRELRPNDPQFELYELDTRDIRSVDDIDRLLSEVRKALGRFPGDLRVEERAGALIASAWGYLDQQYGHLAGQLTRVADQMRRLPAYQINWPAVRDVLRDLQDDFLYLRRTANKCLALTAQEGQKRSLRDLIARIDRKIEVCHSMRA